MRECATGGNLGQLFYFSFRRVSRSVSQIYSNLNMLKSASEASPTELPSGRGHHPPEQLGGRLVGAALGRRDLGLGGDQLAGQGAGEDGAGQPLDPAARRGEP